MKKKKLGPIKGPQPGTEMFNNAILAKVEEAAKNYLDQDDYTVNPSIANYRGIDNKSLTIPRAVVRAENATSEMQDGTWEMDLHIEYIANANDADGPTHHNESAEVFARFMTATIAADLSAAAADLTVQRVIPGQVQSTKRGDEQISTLKLNLKGVVGQSGV